MEQSFLAWLRGRCASLPSVAVGIGDDAAILEWSTGQNGQCDAVVISTDQIADGVDFLLAEHDPRSIGRKAVLINLSDLAAMAARPVAIFVTLSLPREDSTRTAAGIYEGILSVAEQYGTSIAGGDITVYDGPTAVSITIVGSVPPGRRWLRSGAREGDSIIVTGAFGGSILGRHLEPTPRVGAALAIAERFDIHAAIDVSDGLSLDLDRLCAASGVGAEFDTSRIPIHEDARLLAAQGDQTPLDHAWGDGEDFELILAVPADQTDAILAFDAGVPLTRIGKFTGRTGLWARQILHSADPLATQGDAKGGAKKHGEKLSSQLVRMSPRGFIHGRR